MHNIIIKQLQTLAAASPMVEICGVVGSDLQIYPIHNAAKNTTSCFIFDKKEYFNLIKKFKAEGLSVLCVYHSHPTGIVTPSRADLEYTKRSGVPQIIVSSTNYRVVENADRT